MGRKIIAAIHGIGDQFNYETIQSVVYRFCSYHNLPSATPLGYFHREIKQGKACFLDIPLLGDPFKELGFAEVYWAGIPRVPAKEGYILEEPKKWARTIVGRLQLRSKKNGGGLTPTGCAMIEKVLEEMIDTIKVLERLSFLAEKAGVFKFNLRKILTDFLGDVQIVTEFGKYREDILRKYDDVMEGIYNDCPEAEIYLIAHSEGTVIAFLGLLRALRKNSISASECQWVKQVRGFMTIGSPIDKHILLWPELWKDLGKPDGAQDPQSKIKWRNYYDFGDPVGFKLDTAREWLNENGWKAFEFQEDHDYGFSRYYFPGKAHVDYWRDAAVFGHFIEDVVNKPAAGPGAGTEKVPLPKRARETGPSTRYPPASKLGARLVSNLLPYGLVYGVLFLAVFFLYKGMGEYWGADESARQVFRNVLGIAGLLAGVTVTARLPRLTTLWYWRLTGFLAFGLAFIPYHWLVESEVRSRLGGLPLVLFGEDRIKKLLTSLASLVGADAAELSTSAAATLGLFLLGSALLLLVYVTSKRFPDLGTPALIVPGGLALLGLVVFILFSDYTEYTRKGPLWPVLLGGVACLYLWWLAALLFDLIFVWHRYVRWSVAITDLKELTSK